MNVDVRYAAMGMEVGVPLAAARQKRDEAGQIRRPDEADRGQEDEQDG